MTDQEENEREFLIKPDEDEWPYGWVVVCHRTHDSYQKPDLIEAWPDEETAIETGRIRHEQGYVVHVYKSIAFTIGGNA